MGTYDEWVSLSSGFTELLLSHCLEILVNVILYHVTFGSLYRIDEIVAKIAWKLHVLKNGC